MLTEGDVLEIQRGDDEEYTLTFVQTGGAAQPLSGCTVWLTIKPRVVAYPASDDTDATALVRLTWEHDGTSVIAANGIALPVDPVTSIEGSVDDGILIASIPRSVTAALRGGLIGRYDVQIKFPGNKFKTWATGPVKVSLDVTERETVP
jgi:hypothetical protein